MAGTLIVSNLTTDTDNTFIVRSNTGTTLFSANTSGVDIANSIGASAITNDKILSVANTKISGNIISSQIAPSVTLTTPLISGNLNFDATGTSGIRLTSANTITFHTAGTEDVRIDANGNVGIGTASSSYKTHIVSAAGGNTLVLDNGGGTGDGVSTYLAFSGTNTGANFIRGRIRGAFPDATGGGIAFETGTSGSMSEQARINATGDLQFNSGYGSSATAYGCRAWVNFNGAGTVAIRASGNVSSITDNGVGDYTVNFTTAMPDANYSVNTASGASSLRRIINNYGVDGAGTAVPPTTSTIRVICFDESLPGTADMASVSVAIFR